MTNPTAALLVAALVALGLSTSACQSSTPEESQKAFLERMKEIEKRMKDSLPKTQEIALAQKADPATVGKAQTGLRALKEYMDEPTGKIDAVTVNAIQAFQRHEGLDEDGLLTPELAARIERAAAAVEHGDQGYFARRNG
jgi:peptidoglycan hydrolase-like protein with peptidoglycan-binding domain